MRLVVTGAASGIGRAVALRAARTPAGAPSGSGARLLLVDADGERLDAVAAEVAELGGTATPVVADLSDPDAPNVVAARAVETLGGVDGLVSNAGIARAARLVDMTVEDYDAVMSLDARATWLLGKALHSELRSTRGSIVATASISGSQPTPPIGAYSAAKAALIMLVRQMALEWGPDGIRVNTVSPGPTITGMTQAAFGGGSDEQRSNRERREAFIPLRKVGTADEVAAAIMFLLGPDASQITGVDLLVDGGLSLTVMPNSGSGAAAAPNPT